MWLKVGSAIISYIERAVNSVDGMKVLLLDTETVGIVSSVVPQSLLLERQVFLTEYLEKNKERPSIAALKCIVLVRPTSANINALAVELADPRYCEYHIFFTSFLKNGLLERLAEADVSESIKTVCEVYADYYVLHQQSHCTLSVNRIVGLQPCAWRPTALVRCTEGVAALLAGLRRRPNIRYDAGSLLATRFAQEVRDLLVAQHSTVFDFQMTSTEVPPILLILDRRGDLLTPLLLPWTYQSLVHELLFIRNGRVSIADSSKAQLGSVSLEGSSDSVSSKEYVLSQEQDQFWRDNLDSNFGELGVSVRQAVQDLQSRTNAHQNSLSASMPCTMRRFIAEELPEYRRNAADVSKHVALVGEISKLVDRLQLLQRSEAEQAIVAHLGSSPNASLLELLHRMVTDRDDYLSGSSNGNGSSNGSGNGGVGGGGGSNGVKSVTNSSLNVIYSKESENALGGGESLSQFVRRWRVKLALIYALRFQNAALRDGASGYGQQQSTFSLPALFNTLGDALEDDDRRMISFALSQAVGDSAAGGLYAFKGRGQHRLPNKDNDNVYTRHIPPIVDVVDQLIKGRLSQSAFPSLAPIAVGDSASLIGDRVQEVIVFVAGGSTYEEAHYLRRYNENTPGVSIILSGSSLHNSSTIMQELYALSAEFEKT